MQTNKYEAVIYTAYTEQQNRRHSMKFFINKTQRQRFVQNYTTSQNFLSLLNENYIKSNVIGKSSQLQQEHNTKLHPNEVHVSTQL